MKSLYINNNGDIEFDGLNKLKMVEGKDEVIQRNVIGLGINEGEWVFDLLLGLPWIEMMSDKNTTAEDIEREVKDELEADEDIQEVEEIMSEYDNDKRNLIIKFKARLVNGDTFETGIEV